MQRRNRKIAATMTGVILAVVLLRGCVATSYSIPSSGMENSLYRGEHILVNKWSYGLRVPYMSLFSYHRWGESPIHKDDIVVFNNPAGIKEPVIDRREIYISRCIGVPGIRYLSIHSSTWSTVAHNSDRTGNNYIRIRKPRNSNWIHCFLFFYCLTELMGQHEGKNSTELQPL